MNRNELFDKAFSGHPFLNFFYKMPDDVLRERWTKIPQERRDELFPLPPTEPADLEKHNDKIKEYLLKEYADVRKVADYYRFRASEDFMQELPSFFRRVMVLADDDDMLDTLFLGTLGDLSICMPGVRGSLFKEEIRPNLYIFLTGAPPPRGKGR